MPPAQTPEQITDIVSKLSDGQKKSLAYLAKNMMRDGAIDSNKKIAALEDSLGITLVEK